MAGPERWVPTCVMDNTRFVCGPTCSFMPGRALTSIVYSPIAQIIAMQYGLLMSQAARKCEAIQNNSIEDSRARASASILVEGLHLADRSCLMKQAAKQNSET